MSLRVELLGAFAVIGDDVVLEELENQPVRAGLLAFLAVRRHASREEIIGLLWPERSPARARHALSQTLHRLRQVVGHDIITADGDSLSLAADVEVDVAEFEARLEDGNLGAALALYRGHLLLRFPGSSAAFEHWVDRERARLERAHRVARRERLSQCVEAGDTAAALRVAQEWAELDPLEDEAQHALIGLLAEASGRAAALRHYEVYVRLLADEDLTPLPETEVLAQRIREGDAGVIASPVPSESRAAPAPPSGPSAQDTPGPAVAVPAPARRWLLRPARLAALLLLASVLGLLALRPGVMWETANAEPAGRVVLADFSVEGADSSLAAVVTEALRIDLEQNIGTSLLCSREVDAALARMNREPGSPILGPLALEMAVREGAAYVITGQVAGVGDSHILLGRVLRADDGAVVGSLREAAESDDGIIDAIERLSRGLVELTGQSLRRAGDTRPLVHVTTESLDALRLYTEAVRLADTGGDPQRALVLLDQAVAVDSAFAMAYRKIATMLDLSFTERARRVDALQKAFRYRERLPRSERSLVEGAYYEQVTGDHDAAIQAYETALEIDPGNTTALDNLAGLYIERRRQVDADSLLRSCTAVGPVASCHYRRTGLAFALEGEEAARRVIADGERLFPHSLMVAFYRVWIEGAVGNYDVADALVTDGLAGLRGGARTAAVFLTAAADIDAARGRFTEAREHLTEAMEGAEMEGLGDVYYRLGLAEAYYSLEGARDTARAVRTIDALVDHPLVRALDPLDYPYAELAEAYARADRPGPARALLDRFEREVPTVNQPLAAALTARVRGLLALADGRLDDAEAAFVAADRGSETSLSVLPYLARTHERRGDLAAALDDYQAYLDASYLRRMSYDGAYLGRVLERTAALQEAQGDLAAAAGTHRRFAALWADADPEVMARVLQARDDAERLVSSAREPAVPVSGM